MRSIRKFFGTVVLLGLAIYVISLYETGHLDAAPTMVCLAIAGFCELYNILV